MKLAVLDFDSTLLNAESLNDICRHFLSEKEFCNVLKRVKDSCMVADENPFYKALVERVKSLKGVDYSELKSVCQQTTTNYHKGAKILVDGLHERGYKVVIFSGGFREATSLAKEKLGIDEDFANYFIVDSKGKLTGEVGGSMMFLRSKGDMIQQLQNLMSIGIEDTFVAGDSTNDISAFKYAKHSVAFCAEQIVNENATIVIDEPDLSLILKYI